MNVSHDACGFRAQLTGKAIRVCFINGIVIYTRVNSILILSAILYSRYKTFPYT